MADLLKRNKALSVSPLKSSQPMGATLAFLGIQNAMPLLHGSQGCTAFGKVFFVRHFREPIPLQTTALDQVGTIMTPDTNLIEALKTIAEKSKPALIGLATTGLSETQGTDIRGVVKQFRNEYPEHAQVQIVAVNTPDYLGCLESGYAHAVQACIETLVPVDQTQVGKRPRQVNILAGSLLTPGDVESLKETVAAFGLRAVIIPDLGDSLDGHVTAEKFNPLTLGGTPVSEFATLGQAAATLVIGHALFHAADLLQQRTAVPDYRFDSLLGLAAFDRLLMTLQTIAGTPVPSQFTRQRAQLQDAMLDTHFMLGQARIAIAADPDEVYSFSQFLVSVGAEIVAAVVPSHVHSGILEQIPTAQVKIGDLQDLEQRARAAHAQLLIGNSHCVEAAQRLGVPVLRASFPQYDYVGGYSRCWIGYRGTRQLLFDVANLILGNHAAHEIAPYRSRYAQKIDDPKENGHVHPATSADSCLRH